VTVAPTPFNVADFEALISGVPSEARAVVLDSPYFTKVKPLTWLPSSTSVFESSRWSAAGPNIRGFCGDKRAVLTRVGIPAMPALGVPMASELISLPQLGISVEATAWMRLSDRSIRCCYACYFGAAVGDAAALKLLASA